MGKHKNDRTEEAIDWANSVGEEMLAAGVDPDGVADMAISATEEAFGECEIDRDDLMAAIADML